MNPWKKIISKLKNYIKLILLPKKTPCFSTKKKHRLSHEIVKLNPCKPVKALKLQPKRGGQANSIRGWNFLPMLEVTIRLWKGHVNSPFQKGAQRMARQFFWGGLFHKPMEKKGSRKQDQKKTGNQRSKKSWGFSDQFSTIKTYIFTDPWIVGFLWSKYIGKSAFGDPFWHRMVSEWVHLRPFQRRFTKSHDLNHLAVWEDFLVSLEKGKWLWKKTYPRWFKVTLLGWLSDLFKG